jgi:hypothetical protein
MKSLCDRCGKRRICQDIEGPGLHPKGEHICRPCLKAVKFSFKVKKDGATT